MTNNHHKNKGGRPRKEEKRSYRLRVACSAKEVAIIESKASAVGLTLSEFLREAALNSQVVSRQNTLPKEVLSFTAQLNHLAANMNSLAYKNNAAQTFSVFERTELKQLVLEVKQLAAAIKTFLK
ncbi:plasmid mobilization protein [Niabella insulamsoli]|uniref:plasmid mobilization protein n=1 Tax=Niabella insulamsoli TaxID=3144874 RepID=UPI0031FD2FC5